MPISAIALALTILWAGLYYIFPAFLLAWEQLKGWGRAETTFALTAAVVMSAVFSPLAGRLLDHGHGRLLLSGSALLGGLMILLIPFSGTLVDFYVIWGLIGIAMAGCLYEPCFSLLIRYRGEKAGQDIAVVTLAAGFASTVCFPAAGWMITEYGVDVALRVFGFVILCGAVPCLYYGVGAIQKRSSIAPGKQGGEAILYRTFLRSPVFLLLTVAFSLAAMVHGIAQNHLLPMMSEWRIEPDFAIFAIAILGPAQVAGRLIWIAADKKLNIERASLICFTTLGFAAGSLLLASGSATVFLIIFVCLQGAAHGVKNILKPVLMRDMMGSRNFGSVMGTMAVPYLACFAASPYVGSLLWQFAGYGAVRFFMLACGVCAIACLIMAIRRYGQNGVCHKS